MTDPLRAGRSVVKRLTVRDAAEQAIREMILSGEIRPRSRLNEVLIAEQLGISRGPLREAIQRLASEGLLEIVPHKGAFVTVVEETELRQLYELRIAVETFSARIACERAPQAARVAFRASLDGSGAGHANRPDFHSALVALTENPVIQHSAHEVNTRISIARNRSARQPKRAREAKREHIAIADALVAGDAAAASAALEAHLWFSFESAAALFRS